MFWLKLSLSVNVELKSQDANLLVGLPVVWIEMPLRKWQRWYQRGREAVERFNNALKVASIGLEAAKFGVGI